MILLTICAVFIFQIATFVGVIEGAAAIFKPNSIGSDGEYIASVAPYNAFCPLRCPDEVAWPRSEDDLVDYLRDLQKRNISFPITVRGGGHSYTCQSTSSVGTVIDMHSFRKLKLRRTWNDRVEATVGAGLITGEIVTVLDKYGWSLPHGVCSTVGIAGYLLNAGTHPNLQNFVNYYGARDYVTEIRGVTVRGSVLRISDALPKNIEIVSRSPYERISELENMIFHANLLGRKINVNVPGTGGSQRLFRKFGANMFIATEFKLEVRQRPEPLMIIASYPGKSLKNLHPRLHKILDHSWTDIACSLSLFPEMAAHVRGISPDFFPSLLQLPEGLYNSIQFVCLSWKPSSVKSICNQVGEILQETPSHCQKGVSHFPRITEREGYGWYPWYKLVFFPSSSLSLVGRVIDFTYDLHAEANCSVTNGMTIKFMRTSSELDYIYDLKNYTEKRDYIGGAWLGLDLWLADDVENKQECILSTQKLQKSFQDYIDKLGLPHRLLDTHLPDCTESKVDWRQKLYGSNYEDLEVLKAIWDPQAQLSFFGGVSGDSRNPTSCETQFVDRIDENCVAAGVTVDSLVSQVRRSITERMVCDGCDGGCIMDTSCLVKAAKSSLSEPSMWISSLDQQDFRKCFAWSLILVLTVSALVFEWYILKQLGTSATASYESQENSMRLYQTKWRLAKVLFPPLAFVSLLAIPNQNPLGVLLFMLALWKFGFPEMTVYATLVHRFSRKKLWEYVAYNFCTLIAMLVHHLSATITYVFVFTKLVTFDPQLQTIVLWIIIQHLLTSLAGAFERSKIIHAILIFAVIVSEVMLQIECIAYAPVAEQPVKATAYMFSASHYACFAVAGVFLFRHGTVPSFYEPFDSRKPMRETTYAVHRTTLGNSIIVNESGIYDMPVECSSQSDSSICNKTSKKVRISAKTLKSESMADDTKDE